MILITGASGFLGKSIIKYFLSLDKSILTIGRNDCSNIKCDLSSEIPYIDREPVDIVIHAAGKAHLIPITEAQKQSFFDVNLTGTNNLLKALENLDSLPRYFIFISSVAVYGQEIGININEQSPLYAKDPYGLSKIQAEHLVTNWCQKNNIICTILRLPLLVGKNPPGNLGAMIKGIKKSYYFNIGGGTAKKSMVLAKDVAQFIPKVAHIGGIYNLTDGVNPTFFELSKAIAKKKIFSLPLFVVKVFGFLGNFLGEKAPINTLKINKIISDLTFDDSKARELGWKPRSVLEYLKDNNL